VTVDVDDRKARTPQRRLGDREVRAQHGVGPGILDDERCLVGDDVLAEGVQQRRLARVGPWLADAEHPVRYWRVSVTNETTAGGALVARAATRAKPSTTGSGPLSSRPSARRQAGPEADPGGELLGGRRPPAWRAAARGGRGAERRI
jgi:hypothetical protein